MKVGLVDGCFWAFGQQSANLGGENRGLTPQYFEWTTEPGQAVTFYTDICLPQAIGAPGRKVAWLIEPPWKQSHYKFAAEHQGEFEAVLSFLREPVARNGLFYAFGGSYIALEDWAVYDKTEMVSLMLSRKRTAPGHILRHEAAKMPLDVWGHGYRVFDTPVQPFRPYRYSVVIDPWAGDYFFNERLVDCISQGTVPIYWGCPGIGHFFDRRGIIQFQHMDELEEILTGVVSEADYRSRLPYIRLNLELAKRYRCAEDWIYRQYPFLFH